MRLGRPGIGAGLLIGVLAASAVLVAACDGPGSSKAPAVPASPASRSLVGSRLCRQVPQLDGLLVRRTDAFPQNHLKFSFPPEARVTTADRAQAVARALCGLPRMPPGTYHCPSDFGIVYHLSFLATKLTFPSVAVEAAGCQRVTGLGAARWVAHSPDFWPALGASLGLAHADVQTFQGRNSG